MTTPLDSIAETLTNDIGFDGLDFNDALLRMKSAVPPEAAELHHALVATFSSPQGRKTLKWMVRQFMLQPASADPHEALHKAGAHSVIYQILIEMEAGRRVIYGPNSHNPEE